MSVGDVVLLAGHSPEDILIRWAQGRDYPAAIARWTHAMLIVDDQGSVVEAVARGVRLSPASRYVETDHLVLRMPVSNPAARGAAARHARSLIGLEYGFFGALDAGLRLVVGRGLPLVDHDSRFCSQLVAECLVVEGVALRRDPATVTPADLASDFAARRTGDGAV